VYISKLMCMVDLRLNA